MLIVIEGLDGSGKSTQVKRLRKYLSSVSGNLNYIHYPRYEAPLYGDLISRFLRGEFGSLEEVHPQLVALLFALDRHAALPEMTKTLQEGGIVLLDRYVYSNIAYQCSKLDEEEQSSKLKQWILEAEFGYYKLPKPDLNLFLDVPKSFVEGNLSSTRKGKDRAYLDGDGDIHESSIDFQSKVCSIYRTLCEEDDNFIRVDCSDEVGNMLKPELIFAKIKELVDSKLGI